MRFTADSVTCFRLTKDLEAVLGNIRHMEFDLSPLRALLRKKPKRRQALDQKLISFIAEVTATLIEQSDNGQKVSFLLPLQDYRLLC